MKKKRILFDTNIIIQREDPKVLSSDFIELNKIINDLNYKIFIHPLSIADINRDRDEERKSISLSKIATYSSIEKYPDYNQDENFKSQIGVELKENDTVDNALIYAVYKNAVDLLITQDKGILNKAKNLNLQDKILNITDSIINLSQDISLQQIPLLSCFKIDKGWNIDLSDTIFDTLKQEYTDFSDWWQRSVCGTSRDVYVYYSENERDKGKIKAILIIKEEEKEIIDSEPQTILENVLKICLFKVDVSTRGMKLGERLLKMAFEQAAIKNISKLYLTHYTTPNEDKLIELIQTYGFYFLAKKKNGEEVYYKEIKPNRSIAITSREEAININTQYFPSFYDGEQVSKYIIPIQPKFFDRLFPDYKRPVPETSIQLRLDLGIDEINQYTSEGFSIQKAYICNTPVHTMQNGDIVIFYRTEDYKSILTLGVIEKVYYDIDDADSIYKIIKRRTVYSIDEIKEKCGNRNKPVVILFKHNLNFKKEVSYSFLKENNIIDGSIITVRHVKEDDLYKKIIKGNIDESLIIN